MVGKRLSKSKQRFIEDIVRLLVPWGVPQTAARIHGYLLLSAEPATLDRIATDLEVSKSGTSVAARLLEKYGLAVRHSERGSKRIRYEVSRNYESMLIEQCRMLENTATLLKRGADTVTSGKARERLGEMTEFYLAIGHAMDAALQSWRTRKHDQ